jgi:hypothetical protein
MADALATLWCGDGESAARRMEELLLSGTPRQRESAVSWLPIAYVAAGDADRAAERAKELMENAPRDAALRLRHIRGDLECARGDVPAAIELYRSLQRAMTPEEREETLGYTALLDVGVKLALLGRNVPDLRAEWVVGAGETDVRGHVAVLSYLSPFAPDYGVVALARRLRALPNAPPFVGVVPTDANLHVPRNLEYDGPDDAAPPKPTREAVEEWRKRHHAEFPVIGVAPSAAWGEALLFGNCVVVDAQGRVAYVGTNAPQVDEILVRAVLRRVGGR